MSKDRSPLSGPGSRGDLTQGPVEGHLVRLSLPMIWGILSIISFQVVDMYYISLLGIDALAAITFTFPVTLVIFSLILGMGIATSSVISRQIGRGNPARVRRLTTHAIVLAAFSGVLIAAVGCALTEPLFVAMGATPDMLPKIDQYMTIWFAGSVFINTPIVGNAALRASGDTASPAVIMTVCAVANAALAPLLIFGLAGFPRMEMQGAALATVVSNACAMLAGLYVLGVRKKMLARGHKHLRLLGDSARRLMTIAVPAGLTSIIQPLTNAVLTGLLAASGKEAVAAFGIVSRVEALCFVPVMALAVGMSPIIGQNWGAQRMDRARAALDRAILYAAAWSVFVALLLAAGHRIIPAAFSDEMAVIDTAGLYFLMVPATYALGNLVPGWSSAFNAMGFPQRSFVMIFTRLVLVNLPLAVLGERLFGVVGVFASIALANGLTGIGFHMISRRFLSRLWIQG